LDGGSPDGVCSGGLRGGGDSDGADTGSSTGLAVINELSLRAEVELGDQTVFQIRWEDNLTDESGFSIQQLSAGTWLTVKRLPSAAGTKSIVRWGAALQSGATYRVIAHRPGGDALFLHAAGTSNLVVRNGLQAQIKLSMPEPLVDSVELILGDANFQPGSVVYYRDDVEIGRKLSNPTPVLWNTRLTANGVYQLMARASAGNGLYVLCRRAVQVMNPDLQGGITKNGSQGNIYIYGNFFSGIGLRSAQLFIDGVPRQLLTDSNGADPGTYFWIVDLRGLTPGSHQIMVEAINNAGEVYRKTHDLKVNNAPTLTLDEPDDGQYAGDMLAVKGHFADDEPGVVLTLRLGAKVILTTETSPFSLSYSLADLPSGSHTLVVEAKDSAGNVTRTTRKVRRHAVELPQPALIGRLQSGQLYEIFRPATADIGALFLRYRYGDDGIDDGRQDDGTYENPALKGFWVRQPDGTLTRYVSQPFDQRDGDWRVYFEGGRYYLQNLPTMESQSIPRANEIVLTTLATGPSVWMVRETLSQEYSSLFLVRPGAPDLQVTTDSEGHTSLGLQANHQRVAWLQRFEPQKSPLPQSLVVALPGSPQLQTVLSRKAERFWLRGEWIYWEDNTVESGQRVLMADNLSVRLAYVCGTCEVVGAGEGYVIYKDYAGLVWVWYPGQNPQRLLRFPVASLGLDPATRQLVYVDGVNTPTAAIDAVSKEIYYLPADAQRQFIYTLPVP